MKSLKNVLATLAFVVAIGAAFATSKDNSNLDSPITAYKPDKNSICNIRVTCDTVDTGLSCNGYGLAPNECNTIQAGLFEQ